MYQIEIAESCSLATHLREQRIPLKMSCGGHGSCKTCRVMLDGEPVLACQTTVDAGRYDLTVPDNASSSAEISIDMTTLEEGLQCSAYRFSIVEVEVPGSESQANVSNRRRLESVLPEGVRLDSGFFDFLSSEAFNGKIELVCFDNVARFLKDSDERKAYAFAVDIGTTTVAAALIDLEERSIVGSCGKLNGQYAYAEDLVARISFCSTPELLKEMQELCLKRTLAPLLRGLMKAHQIKSRDVMTTVLSGNAPMIHLLLGLDPTGMGGWPFNGVDYAPAARHPARYGLPGESLEFVPSLSAYLGGDIISGLILQNFVKEPDGTLFVDLGTNAEMALKAGGKLLCTAVPAGPSFEGGGFPCGVSAIPGAIDHVWEEDGELKFTTIGGVEAIGLCGSGIISFVAAAFRARILRKKGRFARRSEKIEERELLGERQRVYPLTENIYISEDDISNFLQAKAAVFAGIITLCKSANLDVFSLTRLHLAGNFGRHVRVADMIDIGLIPPIPHDRIEACGNTSLKGAIHASLDSSAIGRMESLLGQLEFIELNEQDEFQDDFINALFIPHLKLDFKPESAEGLAG